MSWKLNEILKRFSQRVQAKAFDDNHYLTQICVKIVFAQFSLLIVQTSLQTMMDYLSSVEE